MSKSDIHKQIAYNSIVHLVDVFFKPRIGEGLAMRNSHYRIYGTQLIRYATGRLNEMQIQPTIIEMANSRISTLERMEMSYRDFERRGYNMERYIVPTLLEIEMLKEGFDVPYDAFETGTSLSKTFIRRILSNLFL